MEKKVFTVYEPGLIVFMMLLCFLIAGCEIENNSSCVTCHTDKETLKELASEVEIIEDSGDG